MTRNTEPAMPFTFDELKSALLRSKNSKAPRCDKLPTDLYKYATVNFKRRLFKFYNKILAEGKIPADFRKKVVVSLYKKSDGDDPNNYTGISLLVTGYKILTQMMAKRIEMHTEPIILECQNGFRRGRSCIDGVFTAKIMMEKRREFNLETLICFIDLEKASHTNNSRLHAYGPQKK